MKTKEENFILTLINKLKSERIFEQIEKEIKETKNNWDAVAKKKVGEVVKRVFYEFFPNTDLAKHVYVESKTNPFELFLGNQVERKNPHNLFGGLGVFPDIAIRIPAFKTKLIFIELDHGRNAAKLKTSLGKAAFNCITPDCDYCLELFHNRGKKPLKEILDRPKERAILEKFETAFRTRLYLFE